MYCLFFERWFTLSQTHGPYPRAQSNNTGAQKSLVIAHYRVGVSA